MVTKEKAEPLIASMRHEIAAVDEELMLEVVGVAQALGELRKALDDVDTCLDSRDFEKAADLGYSSVSSNFVFLQRTLGGLHGLCMDKQRIVQELAAKLSCAYEDVLPYVDVAMQSAQPRKASPRR